MTKYLHRVYYVQRNKKLFEYLYATTCDKAIDLMRDIVNELGDKNVLITKAIRVETQPRDELPLSIKS